jgi:hypothetical protein
MICVPANVAAGKETGPGVPGMVVCCTTRSEGRVDGPQADKSKERRRRRILKRVIGKALILRE